jgi:hypothetical protein
MQIRCQKYAGNKMYNFIVSFYNQLPKGIKYQPVKNLHFSLNLYTFVLITNTYKKNHFLHKVPEEIFKKQLRPKKSNGQAGLTILVDQETPFPPFLSILERIDHYNPPCLAPSFVGKKFN